MPSVKRSIITIALRISRQEPAGFLKDNYGLALRADTHIIFHETAVAEFDGDVQNLGDTRFETGLIERGQPSIPIEIGQQINI
ncbi:MAG: hypothetical protein WB992_10485 [Bryobacteraceae bacterium]